MKVEGTIQKIDKQNNWVVDSPSAASDHTTNRYSHYFTLNGQSYFFLDERLRKNTQPGDSFVLITNNKNEVLAWKNTSKNIGSRYSIFHIVFHSNSIVAIGTFLFLWYVMRSKPEYLEKLYLFGIPVLLIVIIYVFLKGFKQLKAQNEI